MTQTAVAPSTEEGADDKAACADISVDHLDYVVDLISELRELSQRVRLDPLATLLAMAQAEAARELALRRAKGQRN
jgi:hypothetical protein